MKARIAPLAEVAVKVRMELYYHRLHWETWFKQLLSSTDVAKKKMNDAIDTRDGGLWRCIFLWKSKTSD